MPPSGTADSGFILITVLMVMQILTLAAWVGLDNICLTLKISRQWLWSHAMFVHAEMAMDEAEIRVLKKLEHCIVPVMPVRRLFRRYLITGGSGSVCSGWVGNSAYRYRAEFLGVDPCISPRAGRAGEYWRLTLALHEPHRDLPLVLQTIVLQSATAAGVCHGNSRNVPAGRLAWREVDV